MYEGFGTGIKQTRGDVTAIGNKREDNALENKTDVYSEIADIFPALQKYKAEHTTANLQKLCAEVSQFCRSIYASTRSQQEREVYNDMVGKLKK